MSDQIFDASFWDDQYLHHKPGWDIGAPSTPLKTFIDQLTDKNVRILIPGCGNGYEAEYLLQQGFHHLTVIDISPVLTERLSQKLHQYLGKTLTVVTGDFFDLEGSFDLILEQTFFCVFPPVMRAQYVHKVSTLLAPGGTIAGVLFNRDFDAAPPYGGHMEDYIPLFKQSLHLIKMEPCYNSIKPRLGTEVFFIAKRS